MIFRIITSIKHVFYIFADVFVEIICFYLIGKTVRICEQQLTPLHHILVLCNCSENHTSMFYLGLECTCLSKGAYRRLTLFSSCGWLLDYHKRWRGADSLALILIFSHLFHFVTNRTSTLFLMFSMVFPKTELFISLKKSFSKSLAAFALRLVFKVDVWL